MEVENKYGLLLSESDIKLHRIWFKEMCKLIGINVVYYAPRHDKHYTMYTEIKSNYQKPEVVGCIFEEHPTQSTTKKLGWVSELQEGSSLISVPYDLHDIQVGALFAIPSSLDCTKGRLFRVARMSTTMIYPASITLELVPEFENTYSNDQYNYKHTDFNLLEGEEEGEEQCECD